MGYVLRFPNGLKMKIFVAVTLGIIFGSFGAILQQRHDMVLINKAAETTERSIKDKSECRNLLQFCVDIDSRHVDLERFWHTGFETEHARELSCEQKNTK